MSIRKIRRVCTGEVRASGPSVVYECVPSEGAFSLAFRSLPPHPLDPEVPFLRSQAQGLHKVKELRKASP